MAVGDEPMGPQVVATGSERRLGPLGRALVAVARLCMYLSGLTLVAIVAINAVNVFSRYVLFWAISWAEEAMLYLMIVGVFLGAIAVTWDRAHIRIDAFIQMTHGRLRQGLEVLAVLITAAVLLPIGWISFNVVSMLREFDQRSDALHLPVWIPQSALPLALLAIPLVMALALLRGTGGSHGGIGGPEH